jgi:hypothetical protein
MGVVIGVCTNMPGGLEQKLTAKSMAGLAMFDQKYAIAVTIIIVTAFKICISHRKNGLLNRPCTQVSFPTF